MHIDPQAWMFTFPLTLALIQVWMLPPHHAIKRALFEIAQREAQGWEQLGWPAISFDNNFGVKLRRGFAIAAFAGLVFCTLLSFAAFAGLVPCAT